LLISFINSKKIESKAFETKGIVPKIILKKTKIFKELSKKKHQYFHENHLDSETIVLLKIEEGVTLFRVIMRII
jgi:hypothetical protein